ncbi:hypothetical protein [Agrilactobacillus composti]|uniref:hypothetical protein n=1 Tax=Agrilactobacillus composti TaxID=398555 RepID=UPI001F45FBCD|nr:hypothetical protein [Agrilactobacillus composti]
MNQADLEYAQRYYDSLTPASKEALINRAQQFAPEAGAKEIQRLASLPIAEQVQPLIFSEETSGSTDVGDVSWVCPTAQVMVGCEPQGTPPHSWQWVANGKSNIAHEGLLSAGKTIAATAYDLLTEPELIAQAKAEHQKTLNGTVYKSAIPAEVSPK